MYTMVSVHDPATKPLGEAVSGHLIDIPLCLAHYQFIEQYKHGRPVAEVEG
jgi:hypothetical protein